MSNLLEFAATFELYGADYVAVHRVANTFELLEQRREHWGTMDGIPIGQFDAPEGGSPTIVGNIAKKWLSNQPKRLEVGQRVRVGSVGGEVVDLIGDPTTDTAAVVVRIDGGGRRSAYPLQRVRVE